MAPGFAIMLVSIVAMIYAIKVLDGINVIKDAFFFLHANTFVNAAPILISLNIWIRTMAKSIFLVLCPVNLSADYPVPHISSMVDGDFVFSGIVMLLFALSVVLVSKRSRTASFGLLWFLIFVLPVSNVIPITSHYMAERYLYAPSIGYCLFAGVTLTAFYRHKVRVMQERSQKRTVLLLLVIFLALSVHADWRRNRDWESDDTIWAKTVIQQPESPVAHNNFGVFLQTQGKTQEAIRHYQRAIAIYDAYNVRFTEDGRGGKMASKSMTDQYSAAHTNMGSVYVKLKMYKEAISELKIAIPLSVDRSSAYCNLGIAYLSGGETDEAINNLMKSIQLDDNYALAHRALSLAYKNKGMLAEATREYEKAMILSKKSEMSSVLMRQ
jgi:uncharacterized membrane protein